jgi:hypothetical protein
MAMFASKYKPIGIGWVVAASIVSVVSSEPAESADEAEDNAAIVYPNAFELVDELSEEEKKLASTQLAILKLARNVTNESLITGAAAGLAIEGMVYDSLAKCLPELPPEIQRYLALTLSKVPETDYVKKAVIAEKACGVDFLVKSIRELDPGVEGSIKDQESSYAGRLRFAGVTRIAETSLSIGLEEKDSGNAFVLRLGEMKRGVRLVSVDFDREEAVLVKNGEMALVKLRSREIVPLTLQLSKRALSSFMGEQGMHAVSTRHDDPFGDGPFIYKETENGFRLESQLTHWEEPVKLDVGRPESTLDGT